MTRLSFEHIIRQIQELPSLPVVVLELLSSMDQDDTDVHVLAQKIELDQALAAKTLRIANSSFYGMQSKVTSIPQAVSVLGFHSIRTVVTACALTGSFAPVSGGFDFQAFWRHSLATAIAARLLAPHLRVNPETAFTAGLLHDLGTLVLVTRFPAEHALVRSYRQAHDCQMADAELAVIGIDHAQVGSALAAYWKFPEAIQQAVADHHAIDRLEAGGLPLAVHLANAVALALDLAGVDDALVPPLSPAGWRSVALDEQAWLALLRQTEHTFDEMSRIMLA
ncbi:HDOD domain-containing protein [Janthinobacterium lividum]|uniref:HDOD domain-containing protein n=1 Tax=Janthinobacterium lividum TaxID=29581 RepID=A0ABU0XTU2_9BURK|nr:MULTISPECIES: HDOD domain-containing protein [Janthinobacterium]KHA80020.1 histidine kinase [Janthinobacterium lividum]MBR7635452.1 HDOD domain-containing protein [Janthinobacterium lividum]MDO8034219.1 HDOD domain-containing protein [Janthinobacterium sp. SUN128]MDQ4625631.1 HDOD domain-containing protein [Janthinobacterium lividum]MDQ4672766.1 HDOD domain-containing protein [Janthinobacterium lividum]